MTSTSTTEKLKERFEDLKLTDDEVNRFTEALKKEEFRKLLVEYANEISDPNNRKLYEEEITRLENERGVNVKFVNPEPGYVLKTTQNGDTKIFINICKNENINKPTSEITRKVDAVSGVEKKGMTWQIPHSCAPPKEDLDKSGQKCVVYDVVFHPDAYRMAETNQRFKLLIQDSAIETIEKNFKVKIDTSNIKQLKMNFKGTPTATVIRKTVDNEESVPKNEPQDDLMDKLLKTPYKYPPESTVVQENVNKKDDKPTKTTTETTKTQATTTNQQDQYETPKYSIIDRGHIDLQDCVNELKVCVNSTRPKEIAVEIDLPLCKSASNVKLDIFEKQLYLESNKPNYKLDIKLPYPVNENDGQAKFDKTKRRLVVTLPVLPFKMDLPSPSSGNEDSNQNNKLVTELDTPPESPQSQSQSQQNDDTNKISKDDDVKQVVGGGGKPVEPSIKYILPTNYEFKQNNDYLKLAFSVDNINKKSIVISLKSNNLFIKYESVGTGGYSLFYSVYIHFDNKDIIDLSNDYKVDYLNGDKLIELTLKKSNKFFTNKMYLCLNQEDVANAIVSRLVTFFSLEADSEIGIVFVLLSFFSRLI